MALVAGWGGDELRLIAGVLGLVFAVEVFDVFGNCEFAFGAESAGRLEGFGELLGQVL